MRETKKRTRISLVWIAVWLCVIGMLTGCGGGAGNEDSVGASADSGEAVESPAVAEDVSAEIEELRETAAEGETPESLEPDPTNLTYLEEYQIEDFYGDGKEYSLYAPKGGENMDGFFYSDDHGVTFTASVYSGGSLEELQMFLETRVDLLVEEWKDDSEYSEVGVGETLEKGDDRYLFLTAKTTDYNGTPYQRRKLVYMSVRDGNAGVFWDMEVREYAQDEETAPLIAEVARCYGLNLSELAIDEGTWAEQNAQLEADRQDVYEPREGEPVMERVDGYEYLGVVTLNFAEGEAQSPVMAPMGRSVTVRENGLFSSMHGVVVSIGEQKMMGQNFQNNVQHNFDSNYKGEIRSDYSDNVEKSELMILSGYDEAAYYVLQYDSLDSEGEFKYRKTDLHCYIRLNEDYMLTCNIWLDETEFDSTTNAVIREMEKAYGIDMSPYYYKE